MLIWIFICSFEFLFAHLNFYFLISQNEQIFIFILLILIFPKLLIFFLPPLPFQLYSNTNKNCKLHLQLFPFFITTHQWHLPLMVEQHLPICLSFSTTHIFLTHLECICNGSSSSNFFNSIHLVHSSNFPNQSFYETQTQTKFLELR